jgi:EAL domain-containing protein (putative c-di-GMP-specific phosphodiesterase class I)
MSLVVTCLDQAAASWNITAADAMAGGGYAVAAGALVRMLRKRRAGRRARSEDDATDAQMRRKHAMTGDLRRAIERDELMLHYQPLCDGDTLEVCGYEALLRWEHPVLGTIEPAQFVGLAEETGLIHLLGRWVLETACRTAAAWPSQQYVAVNLSPVQMRQRDLAAFVAATLAATGLAPCRLELEVTESVMMEDIERVALVFRALRATGVRLALDDFGTGFSSLSYLRRFPFDRVKIDRSFVQALGEDDGADKIVRLIVGLGQSLGMQVTAEGVETEAQLRTLQDYRCSHVQGFLVGRPASRRSSDHRSRSALARVVFSAGERLRRADAAGQRNAVSLAT